MRRDYFTLTADTEPWKTEGSTLPTLAVTYDGPEGDLTARLTADGSLLTAPDVDVSYRRQPNAEGADSGVLSLTARLTGEYLLEVDAAADTVDSLVEAAREVPGEEGYRVRIERPDADPITYDKRVLLVYDGDGNLERERSLIPSGVEL